MEEPSRALGGENWLRGIARAKPELPGRCPVATVRRGLALRDGEETLSREPGNLTGARAEPELGGPVNARPVCKAGLGVKPW